jgi:hypothetical protein
LVNRGVVFQWEYTEKQDEPPLRRTTSAESSRCTTPVEENPEQPKLEATERPDESRKRKLSQPQTEAGTSKKRPYFVSAEE